MNIRLVHIKWCIHLFIILELFVDKTNSGPPPPPPPSHPPPPPPSPPPPHPPSPPPPPPPPPSPPPPPPTPPPPNIKSVCCIEVGTSEVTNIKAAFPYCTAICTYSGNERTRQQDITILKGKLSYVYIYNHEKHRKMKKHIKSDHVNKFVKEIKQLINDLQIDVMIFDHFTPKSNHWWRRKAKGKFQTELHDFFQKLKMEFPHKLFGLALPKDEKILKKAFKINEIDSAIDVYLVKSVDYKKCKKEQHEKDMETVDSSNPMQQTLTMLKSHEYPLNKCLLDIRVVVKAVNWDEAATKNDRSYATHCSQDPSSKRTKFCAESLEEFYEKGGIAKKYNMMGIVMQSLDYDDHKNACGCGAYAAAENINAGAKGLPPPSSKNCVNWGLLPRDRGKIDALKNSGPISTDESSKDDD